MDKLIIVGRLGRAHGVRGWLHLNSYTTPKENLQQLRPWQIEKDGRWQVIEPETILQHCQKPIVKLPHCDDRDTAADFTNCPIAILRSQLPKPNINEYYWSDLEGLTVINRNNIKLGKIINLFSTGANDVMTVEEIDALGKKQQRLIPYIKHVIDEVNLQEKVIRVDWD
jgi:16S rRNA processing protein RimM